MADSDLEEIKKDAAELVEKVNRHPDIPIQTKNAFRNALSALTGTAPLTYSTVAAVALPFLQTCNECHGLSQKIMTLEAQIAKLQNFINRYLEQDKVAVRRQLAINIEYVAKLKCLQLLNEVVVVDSEESDQKVINADLSQLFERLDRRQTKQVLDMFSQADVKSFTIAIDHMKAFSGEGAHPVSLANEPVTEKVAIEIAAETKARGNARSYVTESQLRKIQRSAEAAAKGLARYRIGVEKYNEHETILVSL